MRQLVAFVLVASPASCIPFTEHRHQRQQRIPPIPCREDFADAAERYFKKLGRAAEIGVYRGFFSRHNLATWSGQYAMIDWWAKRNKSAFEDATVDNFMNGDDRKIAEENVRAYANRVTFVKALSLDAATHFPSEYFDWLYVDALHTYDAVMADLRAWWPKLRDGGLFSGDDYGDEQDTPFVKAKRWSTYYGSVAKMSHWGTIRAVQAFAEEVDRQLFVTWMRPGKNKSTISSMGTGCYSWPAWYIIK